MFDKLVESDTAGAEFKNRSRYFMVSTVVVGILFLTAVVYSLYAAEIGLGSGNFEIAELISPLDTTDPQEQQPDRATAEQSSSDQPVRRILMESTDTSTRVPPDVSSVKNPFRTISADRFLDVKIDSSTESDGTGNRVVGSTCIRNCTGSSSLSATSENDTSDPRSDPPPAITPAQKPPIVSGGVINGRAKFLPTPVYSAAANSVNAQGTVKVQVTINEEGKVISAKAVSGHFLLRPLAEKAAWGATFSPTYLSKVPVKVTGVIVYNFKRT